MMWDLTKRAATVHAVEPCSDEFEPRHLVAASINGDVQAFEQLYRRYAPRIYGLCLRFTGQREAAEDCLQECFVAAWRALAQFENRSRFSTWLQRIAIRTALARRRGAARSHEISEAEAGWPDMVDPAGAAPPLDLEAAIGGLPAGARQVLVLVGIYGYSHLEAAEMLGVAEGTCRAQLHRARALLARALGDPIHE